MSKSVKKEILASEYSSEQVLAAKKPGTYYVPGFFAVSNTSFKLSTFNLEFVKVFLDHSFNF